MVGNRRVRLGAVVWREVTRHTPPALYHSYTTRQPPYYTKIFFSLVCFECSFPLCYGGAPKRSFIVRRTVRYARCWCRVFEQQRERKGGGCQISLFFPPSGRRKTCTKDGACQAQSLLNSLPPSFQFYPIFRFFDAICKKRRKDEASSKKSANVKKNIIKTRLHYRYLAVSPAWSSKGCLFFSLRVSKQAALTHTFAEKGELDLPRRARTSRITTKDDDGTYFSATVGDRANRNRMSF